MAQGLATYAYSRHVHCGEVASPVIRIACAVNYAFDRHGTILYHTQVAQAHAVNALAYILTEVSQNGEQ